MRKSILLCAISLSAQLGCVSVNPAMPVTSSIVGPSGSQSLPVTSLDKMPTGSIRIVGGMLDARRVQYVSSDIAAARVTVLDSTNNAVVVQTTFTGATLSSHLNTTSRVFTFGVDNLLVASAARPAGFSYLARVEFFLDTGLATGIGSSTSTAFTVRAAQVTAVAMPIVTMTATPVGSASASMSVTDTPAPVVVIR